MSEKEILVTVSMAQIMPLIEEHIESERNKFVHLIEAARREGFEAARECWPGCRDHRYDTYDDYAKSREGD